MSTEKAPLFNFLEREFSTFGKGITDASSLSRESSVDPSAGTSSSLKVCVVGGGIAGSTIALGLCEASRLWANLHRKDSRDRSPRETSPPPRAQQPLFLTTLIEASGSLVSGPPFCHLHAGGNLYREIPDEQCVTLLEQCIDVARLFPHTIERRPTVTLVPKDDTMTPPEALIPRLELLKRTYKELIQKYGPTFAVLGDPGDYYKLYSREDMQRLRDFDAAQEELSVSDKWMLPVAKHIVSLDDYKYPVILVAEDGWNMFRQSASCSIALERFTEKPERGPTEVAPSKACLQLRMQTRVVGMRRVPSSRDKESALENDGVYMWEVTMENCETKQQRTQLFDFVVNAAGYQTGKIDDFVLGALAEERALSESPGLKTDKALRESETTSTPQRMVEFKSAYMSRWENACGLSSATKWPEVIFHGIRGTPMGMAQLTPYAANHFQLHGMTKEITLFDEGLVKSMPESAQPQLGPSFLKKLDTVKQGKLEAWDEQEKCQRSRAAIQYLGKFLPQFAREGEVVLVEGKGSIAVNPFCGAQQIPGTDVNLRTVAGVSFLPGEAIGYCRAEIVKANSAICCAENVVEIIRRKVLQKEVGEELDAALREGGRLRGRVLSAAAGAAPHAPSQVLDIAEGAVVERAREICAMRNFPQCLAEPYHGC